MKYTIEISKVIEGALKQDIRKVVNYTNLLLEKLEADGDLKTMKRLKKFIDSYNSDTLSPMESSYITDVPVDNESRSSLADIIYPNENDVNIVLTKKNKNYLNEFIESYKQSDKLSELGLQMANTLLLYGPPGCGKTKSAFYIAKQMNLPLVVARLDSLISSYLGTTSKNIRYLFEFAQKQPCVLFLDEFDALAKARDDSNELGELKRVVNSLLQNVDTLSNDSIMIAATNHDKLLDPAVWRRFDYKVKIDLPDYASIKEMIPIFLKDFYMINDKSCSQLANVMQGMSGAEIEEVINRAVRGAIITQKEMSIQSIFEEVLISKGVISSFEHKSEMRKAAEYFMSLGENFTKLDIANILNISRSTLYGILKEKGEENG